jgi:hypothetical protein
MNCLKADFADNLDGIAKKRLPRFYKPGSTSGPRTSCIFRHGYHVAVRKDVSRPGISAGTLISTIL